MVNFMVQAHSGIIKMQSRLGEGICRMLTKECYGNLMMFDIILVDIP